MSVHTVQLADVCAINPRLVNRPTQETLVSFVPMADLNAESGTTSIGMDRPFGEVAKGYTQFADQDILVAKITPCFENGKIAQARLRQAHGVGSTEFHVVRPNRSLVDDRYLLRYLRQPYIRIAGEKRMTGSGGQRRVPEAYLANLRLPLPPLKKQRRIAGVLDEIDALRTKRREAIAFLDGLARSIFIDMFGRVSDLTQAWPSKILDSVTEQINDCPHSTPKWTEEGEICLRTSNLLYGSWDWTDTRFVSKETFLDRSRRGSVEPGDIILSREGTVGIAAIVEEGMRLCMGQRLVQIRGRTDMLTPKFLLRYLLEILAPDRISQYMVGSTSRHLNVRDLKSLQVPLPPMTLQQVFDERLSKVSAQKELSIAHLAELDALFASAQHRGFHGELWDDPIM
ncbi:restriction endonuclease subunit S [Streptomyces sp. NPDC050428]|uniref:restriction endonuclease subunit S n=1 Tax=Streptomyces sp. NPDC050428 TaxID=3155757 RepID=UPI00341BE4A0